MSGFTRARIILATWAVRRTSQDDCFSRSQEGNFIGAHAGSFCCSLQGHEGALIVDAGLIGVRAMLGFTSAKLL